MEFVFPMKHYDRIYVSKVFGDEYSPEQPLSLMADEIFYGGTGYAIKIENGKEVFEKEKDHDLPEEIEHAFPDYDLYGLKDKAIGFLTRGCPNDCGFCIVSKKEGRVSHKVADLSEFWDGQKNIDLLDANILACRDRQDLLDQLIDSGAVVDFVQGLDARFITEEIAEKLGRIKIRLVHFAFDMMKNEKRVLEGLRIFKDATKLDRRQAIVYILTNYDTSFREDFYRIQKVREIGFDPDVRIYRKDTAPRITRDLQRWCNNRFVFGSCEFKDYAPRKDGRTIAELYPEEMRLVM